MRTALATQDRRALQKVAHSLKGSSGNLGLRQMTKICSALEKDLRSGSWDKVGKQVSELEVAFKRVRRAFEIEVQTVNQ